MILSYSNDHCKTPTNYVERLTGSYPMTKNSHQTTLGSSSGSINSLTDIDWTFDGADTSYLTHGFHTYPARMIPQIPDAILNYYLSEGVIDSGETVYDPFSGSGTTAVEARLHGLNAEGNDINPLAVMLSRAKSIPIDMKTLQAAETALLEDLETRLETVAEQVANGTYEKDSEPDVNDGWFPEPQLKQLWAIRQEIDGIEEQYGVAVARFFRICLSEITRTVSFQRNGEYKRYRMPEEKRADHDPDVYQLFTSSLSENGQRAREFAEQVGDDGHTSSIHYADSRSATSNGDHSVDENSVDIVITSPPYGDHRTTVAYGQFSRDPAIIADQHDSDEMLNVDKTGLGGSNSDFEPLPDLEEWSPSFGKTMESLREKDGRAEDAMDFVRDYYEVMGEVGKILKPGQPSVWVVANRTMSRVNIPLHLITQELCEHLGYEHDVTLPREIPTKTLPWENAPENEEGTKGDLMADENIVILRSPEG